MTKPYFLRLSFFLLIFLQAAVLFPQSLNIERIYPPFWWAGMKNDTLQLMIKGENWTDVEVSLSSGDAQIISSIVAENPAYVFIDLHLAENIQAGNLRFTFKHKRKTANYNYEIKSRESGALRHKGFSREDLIYLILPDRFANGNPNNDIVIGMNENSSYRDSIFSRHGGDLQGIINSLDYLEDLGITALWLNPVYENNQPFASYHGYAPTDHYRIDPRFGSNDLYRELVRLCHEKGIKVIKDLVFNHVGNKHFIYKELPFENWIHRHDTFTFSNFRVTTLLDPYKAKSDLELMKKGWFDRHMPDLNCSDPYLSAFLIQNSIWWIEYAGLNGFRFDTYAYSDLNFMASLVQRVLVEYPDFNMVGEVWDNGIAIQAFFTADNCNNMLLNTHLPGITDFQLYHALNKTLHEAYGWNKGIEAIYYTLCSDFVYNDAFNNLIFLDNHDLSRFYSVAGEDIRKFKMGVGFLLTTRGIPMLYYGTEILMKNFKGPDEMVRENFPGGWPEDPVNKFQQSGRTLIENEAFNFTRTLANKRKNSPALQKGRLVHFVPHEGVYVYFRIFENETIMIVMNASEDEKIIQTARFSEIIGNSDTATNIINASTENLNDLSLTGWEIKILELK